MIVSHCIHLFIDNECAGSAVAIGAHDAEGVVARGQAAEVEHEVVAVAVAGDDLLTYGVVDDYFADAFSALHIEEAAGGVGLEVHVEALDIIDAYVEGDGNPVGGHAALVAGGL